VGNGIYLIARASPTGLGYMSRDFAKHMQPERIILIDPGRRHPLFSDWYGDSRVYNASHWKATSAVVAEALQGARLIVGLETFYSTAVLDIAAAIGAKTIMFPMWECSPPYAGLASAVLCLSDEDAKRYPGGVRCYWPVSTEIIKHSERHWPPWRFAHNAGHSYHNRNSTAQVLAASNWLRGTGAKLLVRSQFQIPDQWLSVLDESGAVSFASGLVTEDRNELYADVDCLVHPMQFPGLSLPTAEAAANGIPVIVSDQPEWSGWPYRVPCQPGPIKQFQIPVKMREPDVESLGRLMRDMATGAIEKADQPRPTTWDDFKGFWESMERRKWKRPQSLR
jgi:hypothetical protein